MTVPAAQQAHSRSRSRSGGSGGSGSNGSSGGARSWQQRQQRQRLQQQRHDEMAELAFRLLMVWDLPTFGRYVFVTQSADGDGRLWLQEGMLLRIAGYGEDRLTEGAEVRNVCRRSGLISRSSGLQAGPGRWWSRRWPRRAICTYAEL